jgi:bifunctional DNase/RNase
MPRMVEVVIDSVRVSLTNQQRIVVLREIESERYLSIWIGPYEAEAITIALQEIEVARPQTHDLLRNTLVQLNARLVRVEVLSLREDVFFGNLVIEQDGRTLNVDARPSDALALAVRSHVPVLIAKEVMDAAAVTPDQELSQTSQSGSSQEPPQAPGPSTSASGEVSDSAGRLSVFADFLSNLNLDDLSNSADEDDEPDEGKPDKKK